MTRISMIEENEATGELKELYKESKKAWGQVGTIAKTMGHKPNILKGFGALSNAIMSDDSVDKKLQEKIILRVSKINGCDYCVGAHTMMAKKVGLSDEEIKVCQLDNLEDQNLKANELIALKYATEVTKNVSCSDETFNELKKHFNDEQIVQLTSLIALFNYLNRFNDALEVDIDYK